MAESIDQGMMMTLLDYTYDMVVDGVPGLDSAEDMANAYVSGDGSLADKANSLVNWQVAKAGTSGFLTGLGGLLTLPVAIPANIASVVYVQMRMIAAIAHMGGHNLRDDRVRTLVYVCMAGNSAKDIMKGAGIVVGQKLAVTTIKSISGKTLTAINQKVGFRLITKFGEKGVINLGKMVPIVGGVIGGTFDSVSTKVIGNVALSTFIGTEAAPELT